ncbi:hypothetical protein [Natribacillus halophilus]|uniref:Uncharacterized protein n=1 Tax=Natribacillus halophilus TaxID=549003 RepID=A0A1G8RU93_9BACI|nr:hypothetical protein [Natribacillus halophilus]SDJ20571.1 hypothetical protein SAMN04488123_12052 [Natribacillus halophilus]
MDRWYVYGFLKDVDGKTSMDELIDVFPELSDDEIHNGIFEYTGMQQENKDYFGALSLNEKLNIHGQYQQKWRSKASRGPDKSMDYSKIYSASDSWPGSR